MEDYYAKMFEWDIIIRSDLVLLIASLRFSEYIYYSSFLYPFLVHLQIDGKNKSPEKMTSLAGELYMWRARENRAQPARISLSDWLFLSGSRWSIL